MVQSPERGSNDVYAFGDVFSGSFSSLPPYIQILLRLLYEYLEHALSTWKANSCVGVRTSMPGPFLCLQGVGWELMRINLGHK